MRASQEPRYASRLVNDLSRQHLRFAPGLIEGENAKLFKAVLKGIELSLDELSRNPQEWSATNRLLAAGERLSALVVAHHLQKFGIEAHPVGAEDIGLKLKGVNRAKSGYKAKSILKHENGDMLTQQDLKEGKKGKAHVIRNTEEAKRAAGGIPWRRA